MKIGLSGGFRCKSDNILLALGRPTVQAREYPNVLMEVHGESPVNIQIALVEAFGEIPIIS